MTVAARGSPPAPASGLRRALQAPARAGQLRYAVIAVPLALYVGAVLVRLAALAQVTFPLTEGSAYYTAVARNLVAGRGLVIDAIWSYSTPPLTLPRPAFELWQPMASLLAAVPMEFFGTTFTAAQVSAALVGSLLAPLAWLVARDTASRLALPAQRATGVSLGAGLVAMVFGPFLLATAVPDSSLPFTVTAVAACLLMPSALAGNRATTVALGVLLGVAYLTRLEAIYLGLTLVVLAVAAGVGVRATSRLVVALLAIGALVALPWWLRNVQVFGSPLPGQVSDNLFLTHNEQIFAYTEAPSFEAFLAQGPAQIAANVVAAAWHNLYDVLIIPAAPVVLTGLVAVAASLWLRGYRRTSLRTGPLAGMLVFGGLTFVFTSVLFPIATLWGTFEHAAGALLVGLIVAAVVGTDSLIHWVGQRRGWQRNNAWIAPLALLVMVIPLAGLQIGFAARQTADEQRLFSALAVNLPPALVSAGVTAGSPIITDRPIWLSDALGRPTLALPDEPPSSVALLAADFGAQVVVVVKERGRYPAELSSGGGQCFAPLVSGALPPGVAVFTIPPGCMP